MKIYANQTSDIETLISYAGKDVWILCIGPEGLMYVRVLGPSPRYFNSDTTYRVNLLNNAQLDKFFTAHRSSVMSYLTSTYNFDLSRLEIVWPMQKFSTKDLYSDYDIDITQFDKYIGKDIWILAHAYGGTDYYVKPLSRSGNSLSAKQIPAEYLTATWPIEPDDFYRWATYLNNDEYYINGVDSWEIIQPVDLVTSADILAELEYNKAAEGHPDEN